LALATGGPAHNIDNEGGQEESGGERRSTIHRFSAAGLNETPLCVNPTEMTTRMTAAAERAREHDQVNERVEAVRLRPFVQYLIRRLLGAGQSKTDRVQGEDVQRRRGRQESVSGCPSGQAGSLTLALHSSLSLSCLFAALQNEEPRRDHPDLAI